jgi:23S rRNA pseudouridine1911/1915/1917 synthase
MEVRASGARASTTFHLLAESREERCLHRLLEVGLETGHRHQIRVHLAWLGCSVFGDAMYGVAADEGLKLHAASIDLSKVFDTETEIVVPPNDAWLREFRPSKT